MQAAVPGSDAPAAANLERVWHFGRVTGDLERIIALFQGSLGLPLRDSALKLELLRFMARHPLPSGPFFKISGMRT